MRLRTVLAAALLAALALGVAGAQAQDAGDRVVVTLTSGKKFTGTMVSRTDRQLILQVGNLPVALPSSMIATVERDRGGVEPVRPAASAKPPAPPAPGTPAGADDSGEPRPATILLKDGAVIEGFLVKRADGRVWIVPGRAVSLAEEEVDEVFGEVLGEGGMVLTGDAAKDSFRLVKDLASPDFARAKAAAAAIEAYGADAVPALLKGLRDENPEVRSLCLSLVAVKGLEESVEPTLNLLRYDPETSIRMEACEALVHKDRPQVRRALLEAAWRDRDENVRVAAARVVGRLATVEEVGALIDLLNILPPGSKSREGIYRGLRKGSGEQFADNADLWLSWWEERGGKEAIAERVQQTILDRMEREARGR